jgi:uncharacterized protein (TIGR00299 family) protein
MKILYFDCFSGISGDMTLSALVDLGVDKDLLIHELQKLNLPGWEIEFSEAVKHGIGAKQINVILDEPSHSHFHLFHSPTKHTHVHRTMSDIVSLIYNSSISAGAKDSAKRIFMRLAVAEAKIHGSTPDEVHFHEVGAVDSIIDIVGTAICLDILAPDKIYASVLHDGYGFVKCQHGKIPVPVPAVTEMLATRQDASFRQLDIEGEMMTPTGAAIVLEISENFGVMPERKIMKTGYGAGKKDFSIPNVLRVVMGETVETVASDSVTVIETNIDDTTPEILGYVMEKLLGAGAKDVFFTPVYKKKNRPATQLTVLCDAAQIPQMEQILFAETSTIGLRRTQAARNYLPREIVKVTTPYGEVQAKKVSFGSTARINLEYEDACRLAKEKDVPLLDIYRSLQ